MSQVSYTPEGLDWIMFQVHGRLQQLAQLVAAGSAQGASTRMVALSSVLFVYQDIEVEARQHRERLPALLDSTDTGVMLDAFKLLGSLIERFGHMQLSLGALLGATEAADSTGTNPL